MALTRLRLVLLVASLVAFQAGCQSPAEQRAAFEAALRESCRSQGFTEGTDAFRMCLLLERTHARIVILENRLDELEFDIRLRDAFRFDCRRCK